MAMNNGCNNNNLYWNPCLNWINSPVYQSMAMTILATYFNRTTLMHQFYNTPRNKRAGYLVCLLYQMCGKLLDPDNGLDGLFRSGQWEHCYHAVRDILQGKRITPLGPLQRSDPRDRMIRDGRNMVVTRADELRRNVPLGRNMGVTVTRNDELRGNVPVIDNKGKRSMVEPIIKPSKRPCSVFERGEPSWINQSEAYKVMNLGPTPSNSSEVDVSEDDEVSLELTLGRPDYIGK